MRQHGDLSECQYLSGYAHMRGHDYLLRLGGGNLRRRADVQQLPNLLRHIDLPEHGDLPGHLYLRPGVVSPHVPGYDHLLRQ